MKPPINATTPEKRAWLASELQSLAPDYIPQAQVDEALEALSKLDDRFIRGMYADWRDY